MVAGMYHFIPGVMIQGRDIDQSCCIDPDKGIQKTKHIVKYYIKQRYFNRNFFDKLEKHAKEKEEKRKEK